MTQLISAHPPAREWAAARSLPDSPRRGCVSRPGVHNKPAALWPGAAQQAPPSPAPPLCTPPPSGPVTPAPAPPAACGGCRLLLLLPQEHRAKWTSDSRPPPAPMRPQPPRPIYLRPSRRRPGAPTHIACEDRSQRTSTLPAPWRQRKPEPGPAGAAGAGARGRPAGGAGAAARGSAPHAAAGDLPPAALPGGEPGTHMPRPRARMAGRPGPRGAGTGMRLFPDPRPRRGAWAQTPSGETLPSQPLRQRRLSGPGPPRSPRAPAPRLRGHLCGAAGRPGPQPGPSAQGALAAARRTHPSSSAAASARAPFCSTGRRAPGRASSCPSTPGLPSVPSAPRPHSGRAAVPRAGGPPPLESLPPQVSRPGGTGSPGELQPAAEAPAKTRPGCAGLTSHGNKHLSARAGPGRWGGREGRPGSGGAACSPGTAAPSWPAPSSQHSGTQGPPKCK